MNENARLFFMVHNLSGHEKLLDDIMIFLHRMPCRFLPLFY